MGNYRRPGPRRNFFRSIASAAESFRSTCGSERRAPECSTQRFPAATPHVGQGTEDNCFAVRSFFFILRRCDKTSRKTVPSRTLCAIAVGNWPQPSYPRAESTFLAFLGQWDEKICHFYDTCAFLGECSATDLLDHHQWAKKNRNPWPKAGILHIWADFCVKATLGAFN
jgi:hypothetical protein